jgi:ABC-2 type transport system ATP-binding protein
MDGIQVEGVTFRHGSGPDVLSCLSLTAPRGQVVGLLGANGAGKTTLLRLIAGLGRARVGKIRVAGLDVAIHRREASRRVGFVPDEPLLYPKMSALENVNRFALLWGVPAQEARARGEGWLKQAGLWNERNVLIEGYSRGMRQKLAVVLALLHCPSVLVLDEPFNGLDLGAALWLRELLLSRARQGDCVLLSSHQPDALDAVSDKLAVLKDGRIVRELDRAELSHEGGSVKVFVSTCGGAEGIPCHAEGAA